MQCESSSIGNSSTDAPAVADNEYNSTPIPPRSETIPRVAASMSVSNPSASYPDECLAGDNGLPLPSTGANRSFSTNDDGLICPDDADKKMPSNTDSGHHHVPCMELFITDQDDVVATDVITDASSELPKVGDQKSASSHDTADSGDTPTLLTSPVPTLAAHTGHPRRLRLQQHGSLNKALITSAQIKWTWIHIIYSLIQLYLLLLCT